jgi:hypothetical protein
MERCSICHTLIRPGEETETCPECRSSYHAACWEELGGCATYGCGEAAPAEKAPVPHGETGWGDVKTCPACRREIHPASLYCRCGAEFPHVDPMTPREYRDYLAGLQWAKNTRRLLAFLFALSLTGILAPVSGTIAGIVSNRNRERLAGSDGTYLAMGYGATALGALYLLLALILVAKL